MTIVDNNDSYPAGAIMWFASTTAVPGWFLLDGSVFDETVNPQLYALLGENVLPDFNGTFVNGTHTQSQIDGFTLHNDTTRTPRNTAFKTSTTGNHRHTDLTNFDYIGNSLAHASMDTAGSVTVQSYTAYNTIQSSDPLDFEVEEENYRVNMSSSYDVANGAGVANFITGKVNTSDAAITYTDKVVVLIVVMMVCLPILRMVQSQIQIQIQYRQHLV